MDGAFDRAGTIAASGNRDDLVQASARRHPALSTIQIPSACLVWRRLS